MPEPVERHLRVQRWARHYLIGDPAGARELWIACHGYGQLAAPFARALEPLRDSRRVVVVPEALNRFYLDDPARPHGADSPIGAGWMTREDREREIEDYVSYLDALAAAVRGEMQAPPGEAIALGFSQGVATVCRWAALGRTRFARLVLWGGSVPQDLPRDRGAALFHGAALLLVAGRKDTLVPPEAVGRQRDAFVHAGLSAELALHDGGHALNSELLRRLSRATVSSDA